MIAQTTETPYYAVVFTSLGKNIGEDYHDMALQMERLANLQDGFLGIESARDGIGITVSYWKSLDSIKKWKANVDHKVAQKKGKELWYKEFAVRICKVERDYFFNI